MHQPTSGSSQDTKNTDKREKRETADGRGETADGRRVNSSEKNNIRQGIQSIKKVIETHNDVDKAMQHPELGWISFIWGRPGDANRNFAGGYGISHIIAKRDYEGENDPVFEGQKGKDIALRLPVVIAKGKTSKKIEGGRKKIIRYAGYRVVLRLDKDGKEKKWVLTGFRESENRKNPDKTAQLVSLERFYATESYKFTRNQTGAGFDLTQDTKKADKRENPFKPASKDDIQRLVRMAKSDKDLKQFIDLSLVEKSIAKTVKELTGEDVQEYKHVLTADEIRHIFDIHGDKESEEKRGQLPITKKDFSNLLSILNNPDKITKGEKNNVGLQAIIYQKELDEKIYCVEEIRTGRKKLAVKTMWKHRIREPRANSQNERVAHTSKTFPDHNTSTKKLLWEKAQSTHRKNATPGAVSGHSSSEHKYTKNADKRENPVDPLIYIGTTERIDIETGNGLKAVEGEFPTFVSDNKLYIVPKRRVKKVQQAVEEKAAIAGYEQWHNYEADDTDYEIDWPDKEPAQSAGTAVNIWYASDKVIQQGDAKGEMNFYVHEFDHGKRPAVVKDDILIIGNIEWNERGLLN